MGNFEAISGGQSKEGFIYLGGLRWMGTVAHGHVNVVVELIKTAPVSTPSDHWNLTQLELVP